MVSGEEIQAVVVGPVEVVHKMVFGLIKLVRGCVQSGVVAL